VQLSENPYVPYPNNLVLGRKDFEVVVEVSQVGAPFEALCCGQNTIFSPKARQMLSVSQDVTRFFPAVLADIRHFKTTFRRLFFLGLIVFAIREIKLNRVVKSFK